MKFKKVVSMIIAGLLVLTLLAAAGPVLAEEAAEDTPITLSYSMALPTSHKFYTYDNMWIDKITELSDGSITIDPHWAGSLVPPTSSYAELTAGVCDIINSVAGNELEHFVVDSTIQYFYWGLTDPYDLLEVTQQLWDSTPEWRAEYEGTEKLTFGTSGKAYLLSTKPINSLDDIKGMTIRGQCDVNYELINYLGGSAVKMGLGTVYESLSSGTIDAVLIPVDAYESLVLADICPYIYDFGFAEPWYVHKYMNIDSWNKLSAHQQEVLKEASQYRQDIELEDLQNALDSGIAYAKENGVEVQMLSDEDYAKINEALEAIALQKVEELNAKGFDATAMYEKAREIVAQYIK